VAIKQLCRECNVEKVDAGPKGAVLAFHNDTFPNPEGLVAFVKQEVGTVHLRAADNKLVYRRRWDEPDERITGVQQLLHKLVKVAHPDREAA